MYCVIYQFHPKYGLETEFIDCWIEMTELIKTNLGGLGSRLHKTDDGKLFAYAQWPDKASWENMWNQEETGRMAELSAIWKDSANPSEIIFSGEVIKNLFIE